MWLTIVSSLWFVFGCVSTQTETKDSAPARNTNHITEFKHGAKLNVDYTPAKDRTEIYHYFPSNGSNLKQPPLKPDVTIAGEKVKGKHSFEFLDSVSFTGRKPSTAPTNTSFVITHGITNRKEWHFPAKAKLTIVADGQSFDVPFYSQTELKKDDPSDVEFYEVLFTTPTYEMYAKIADAKAVQIKMGTASFNLDSEFIASYRDFVSYLRPNGK
jgi:hypothetical protein